MKAMFLVRYGDPDKAFELREAPEPTPQAGSVRIAVEAFGLNFADVVARLGQYREAPPPPCILGYEVVGRIDALGQGVSELKIGQRVVALTRFGSYAESAVADARAVVPIGDDLDAGEAAALATQGATAFHSAEEAVRLYPGDHVLVQAAAGGVGTLLVQAARHRGCVVYGTAGSAKKLEYLRQLGVDHPINYTEVEFDTAIRKIRGKQGLDVIFDSIGGAAVRKGLRLLAPGGRIVCFGAAAHTSRHFQTAKSLKFVAEFGFPHPVFLMMRSKSFLGVNMLAIADERPNILKRALDGAARYHREGVFRPTVGGRYEVEKLAEAHQALESRGTVGKLVVHWR